MANSFSIVEAASYVGVTVPQFRRAVERGELPQPFIHCRPQRWSKVQLDRALEGGAVFAASLVPPDPIEADINALRHALRR